MAEPEVEVIIIVRNANDRTLCVASRDTFRPGDGIPARIAHTATDAASKAAEMFMLNGQDQPFVDRDLRKKAL